VKLTSNLANERVEGEGNHGCDGYTFRASTGVEDFGGNDPRQGTAGRREGEVVQPSPSAVRHMRGSLRFGLTL
jgi:hypothetical protein